MTIKLDAGGSPLTQANRLLKVLTPVFPENTLLLNRFTGTESVSEPYEFRLSLLSEQADLELKVLMGESMTVTLLTSWQKERAFHGYVTSFSHTGSDGGLAHYEATLGPWTEFLKHRYNCRVFQAMSVVDILRKIFDAPEYRPYAKYELCLKESSYQPLTLCVQYNESDFNFVSRLMEEHGIYYHFTFEKEGHKLMVRDQSSDCPPMPLQEKIEYNTEAGATKNDTIVAWSPVRRLVSNSYAAKTFDFKKPSDPMNAKVDTNHQMGDLPKMERYEYPGAYAFKDDQAGDRFVKLRIEEQELQSKLFHGRGNVRSLTCAHAFELKNHYDLGGSVHDRTFFVMSILHQGTNNFLEGGQDSVYENQFTCIRKKIPFRPGRRTPKPTMRGLQSATVVGASSDEIHCDKYGRVLLQFHWDREGQFNDQSLCWVRVATQWAGSQFGFVSLPRAGTEVLVDFLEGDPDRPIITGAVYNQSNMPPWELPTNKTQSGILTRSSKGGGYENANALRFEDKKGEEEVWLHAEKDQRIEVENDEKHEVGHDRVKHIMNDETVTVDNNRTESVGGNESVTVSGYQNHTISQFKNENIGLAHTQQVGAAKTVSVGGAYALTVGAAMNTAVGLAQFEEVGLNQTIIIGKNQSTDVSDNQTVTIGKNQSIDVSENQTTKVGKKIILDAGDELAIQVGEARLIMKKDGTITLKGKDIQVQSSAGTTIKATGTLTLKGQKIAEN